MAFGARVAFPRASAGFEGRFKIDRTKFGVETYSGSLGDEVTMTFAIEGIAKDS